MGWPFDQAQDRRTPITTVERKTLDRVLAQLGAGGYFNALISRELYYETSFYISRVVRNQMNSTLNLFSTMTPKSRFTGIVSLLSFLLLFQINTTVKGQILKKSANPLLKAQSMHWYGLDFSNLVMFDHTQIGKAEQVKKIVFFEWQAYFNKHVTDDQLLRWFKKSEIRDHRKTFYKSHANLDTLTFIRGKRLGLTEDKHIQEVLGEVAFEENPLLLTSHELSVTQIDSCIKSYKLEESNGLGVIMIVEKMSKPDENTKVVGVFFDISTRQTLAIIRGRGGWGRWGLVPIYGTGIIDASADIGDEFRSVILKQFK